MQNVTKFGILIAIVEILLTSQMSLVAMETILAGHSLVTKMCV